MNSRGAIQRVVVCVLLSLGSASWAGEPNETPIHLEFEISPTPLPAASLPIVRSGNNAWKDFNAIEPGYAADIAIVGPTAFIPFPNRRSGSDKDRFVEAAMRRTDLSEGQQALLGILQEMYKAQAQPLRNRIDPNHAEHLLLYAMTPEDARKMAEIYVQFAADRFRRSLDWQQSGIGDLSDQLAGHQKKLSELGQSGDTTGKHLQELRKLVPYRTVEQANDAIAELDKTLNPARVEIAGLQAKLKAIQEHMKTISPTNQELRLKLETMFVEESISLQVAEARYRMAQELRKQANDYTDLMQAQTRIVQEKLQIEKDLPDLSKKLQDAKDSLQNTLREEPQIPTKIVIRPIEWADAGQGN